ncbi:MAG: hypothetical protein ACLUGT_05355, partial [Lactobacillaceae bacterium]
LQGGKGGYFVGVAVCIIFLLIRPSPIIQAECPSVLTSRYLSNIVPRTGTFGVAYFLVLP